MATKQKLTRATKREMVVPFSDEHNFIVPKKGGFMQPDNERYVMAVGNQTATPSNLPTDGSANTGSGTGIAITTAGEPIYQPTSPSTAEVNCMNSGGTWVNGACVSSQPPPATAQQLCASSGGLWVNGACQTSPAPEPLPAETTCINGGGAWINGACVTTTNPKVTDTPIVSDLPTFPIWSSLDCTTLKDKIAEYNATLSTSRFAQNIIEAYNTEIAKAQGIYNGKCNATPTTTTPPIAIIGGGGGGFGGGGGGLGEPPPSDEIIEEEKKGGINGLLLILGVVGVLYFLTKKSS
mgnify:CR=1 FL=1